VALKTGNLRVPTAEERVESLANRRGAGAEEVAGTGECRQAENDAEFCPTCEAEGCKHKCCKAKCDACKALEPEPETSDEHCEPREGFSEKKAFCMNCALPDCNRLAGTAPDGSAPGGSEWSLSNSDSLLCRKSCKAPSKKSESQPDVLPEQKDAGGGGGPAPKCNPRWKQNSPVKCPICVTMKCHDPCCKVKCDDCKAFETVEAAPAPVKPRGACAWAKNHKSICDYCTDKIINCNDDCCKTSCPQRCPPTPGVTCHAEKNPAAIPSTMCCDRSDKTLKLLSDGFVQEMTLRWCKVRRAKK
jgi:hypothetical protein